MLEERTPEQEKLFNVYAEKWIKVGLSTERFTEEEATGIIENLYCLLEYPAHPYLYVAESPREAWYATLFLFNLGGDGLKVRDNVGAKVWDKVRAKVRDKVGDKVWAKVRDKVGAKVRDKVWAKVGAKVWAKVLDKVGDKIPDFVYPYADGNFSAGFFAYYDYMKEVLHVDFGELSGDYEIYKSITKLSLVYPFEDFCVVCQKPEEIHFNKDDNLHKEGGAAIRYSDGFSVWSLNGVTVSQEVAETPSDKLSAQLMLTEKNAEVRREIYRKIGAERVAHDLGAKERDRKGDYELLLIPMGNGREHPFLKMKNPSIGVYHLEAVHRDCKTVNQALNFRKGRPIDSEWKEPLFTA